jgi:Ser/Thr protein kinase RdoA (MazF antagonist)
LSAAALADLVFQEYNVPSFPACRFWRKGMSDAYRVESSDRLFFLKISMAKRRSREEIDEEVRLLVHLAKGGVSVAGPVPRKDGGLVTALAAPEGERYAVLYEGARGVEGTTRRHRLELGRMVALMHRSADDLQPPYRRDDLELPHVLNDNLEAIGSLMEHRRDELAVITTIAEHARRVITSALMPRPPEHGPCHGDLHGGDVLYSADRVPAIFDFDSSGQGWRALDIAVFQGSRDWMDTSEEAEVQRRREVDEFLEGYLTIRELSSGERKVLRLDGAVHHIFLMGTVLRWWRERDGHHWADDSFIDWHMKWFRHWIEHHPTAR